MPCNLPAASSYPQTSDQSNLSLECLTARTPNPIRIVLYAVAVRSINLIKRLSELLTVIRGVKIIKRSFARIFVE